MAVIFVDQEFHFANGYGASVIHDPRDRSKAEIAVTNSRGEFVYDSGITQDVLAGVDPIDVDRVLDRIAALPLRPSDAPSGEATRPHKRQSVEALPDGSVVAARDKVFIKNHPTPTASWRGSDGGYHGDWRINDALRDGAVVLRVGYGETEE